MIESYSFGNIKINGKSYTSDVIIYEDRVDGNWWRKEGHSLHPEDLKEMVKEKPEVIIIGTGAYGVMKIPEETVEWIESSGIEIMGKPTKEAVDLYNEIAGRKKTFAGLHLTC